MAVPSLSSETSIAGAAVYTAVERFFRLPRSKRFDSDECAMAARRTERFTDHATIPRHARTASPMNPRIAPTAIKTVPSGVFEVCMYGAPAVGGTVTMAPPFPVVDEDVDVVVVETEDVVVVLAEDVEEVDSDDEVVVVESMLVVLGEELDVELVVLPDVDDVDSEVNVVVSVTLGALSVVEEESSVVWAASVVASDLEFSAGSADTLVAITKTSNKSKIREEWDFPGFPVRTRIVSRSSNRSFLHSGSEGKSADRSER